MLIIFFMNISFSHVSSYFNMEADELSKKVVSLKEGLLCFKEELEGKIICRGMEDFFCFVSDLEMVLVDSFFVLLCSWTFLVYSYFVGYSEVLLFVLVEGWKQLMYMMKILKTGSLLEECFCFIEEGFFFSWEV